MNTSNPPSAGADADDYLTRAVQLAVDNVRDHGGPFGALIVERSGRVFEGTNRVTANNDPTAHAEVTAIRTACAELGTFDLSGATLYTSCEPCPMCLASSLWARVDGIVFAADRHDAAAGGFDDAVFYDYFDTPVEKRSMRAVHQDPGGIAAVAPFDEWNQTTSRIAY